MELSVKTRVVSDIVVVSALLFWFRSTLAEPPKIGLGTDFLFPRRSYFCCYLAVPLERTAIRYLA